MDVKRGLLVAVIALMLVTAGCLGANDSGDTGGVEPGEGDGGGGDGAHDAGDSAGVDEEFAAIDGDGFADAAAAERRLIRTGEVHLTVDSFEAADAEIRSVADARGGFVSDASRETRDRRGEAFTVGTLTLRVPSEEFDAAMRDVEAAGDVERSSTESEDVTDELTDIEARLENRRAERDRLRTLYQRANRTEDVLAVGSELTATQEEIERLEARQAALRERVALSTIHVRLSEEPPEPEALGAWYDTGVVDAFLESVSGVGTLLRASVVGIAYAAPYVLTLGVPLVVVGLLARRFGGRLLVAGDE